MTAGTASRASWKNQPLPEVRARIAYRRAFDREDHARVTRGLVPKQTEDKWFVYHEAPWLFFHRSRTGICVYALPLRAEGEGTAVEGPWVNPAPEEYPATDTPHATPTLSFPAQPLPTSPPAPLP